MEMKPGHLLYLAAIDEKGSFVHAADALGISQPALSLSIQRIEKIAGTRLVERSRKGATLTPAGQVLARRGLEIRGAMSAAAMEIELFSEGISGGLRVGGTPLSTNIIIPEIISKIVQTSANVQIDVVEGVDEELLEKLVRNELDVVIGAPGQSPIPPEIQSTPMFLAQTVLVVRNKHPLVEKSHVSLSHLSQALWAIPPEGGAFRKQIEALFTANEIAFPKRIIQTSSLPILLRIVRHTDALTLASAQVVQDELANKQLSYVTLSEPVAARRFSLHTRNKSSMSNLCQLFCNLATELAANFEIKLRKP